MNTNSLQDFFQQVAEENSIKNKQQKRKEFFQNIGRKGGLNKKNGSLLNKTISIRMKEEEDQILLLKIAKLPIKKSTYIRYILCEKELKINEFKTDKILLDYGNNFIRIKNLLRNSEWNFIENKEKILQEIDEVLHLMRDYLYQKTIKKDE